MIDTDKYEGHTPAPWKINEIHSSQRWTGRKPVDVLLAEDAPLLLAEVKRLRKALLLIADTANGTALLKPITVYPHTPELVHEVLKELIE